MSEHQHHACCRRIGVVTVAKGPMKSGKSSWLIQQARRYVSIRKRVIVIRPSTKVETRDKPEGISTHDDVHYPNNEYVATVILEKTTDISLHEDAMSLAAAVLIEEAQFFTEDLSEVVERLAMDGKNVYIAGLSGTFQRKPWPTMVALESLADDTLVFKAVCECGADAPFTRSITKDLDPTKNHPGNTHFESVCRNCFNGK